MIAWDKLPPHKEYPHTKPTSEYQHGYEAGQRAERERCARIAEHAPDGYYMDGLEIAAAIRGQNGAPEEDDCCGDVNENLKPLDYQP